MEGGKASKQGVPQGGVISPLVANLYMNRFLKYWRQSGRNEAWQAHVINYADDFVILSRGHAAEALAWTDRVMTRLGLTLNRTKTRLCDARKRDPGSGKRGNVGGSVRQAEPSVAGMVRLLQPWVPLHRGPRNRVSPL